MTILVVEIVEHQWQYFIIFLLNTVIFLKDGIIRKMEEGTIINICIGVPGEGERIRNLTSLER